MPLHSSLGDRARFPLKKRQKQNKTKKNLTIIAEYKGEPACHTAKERARKRRVGARLFKQPYLT